MKQKGLAGIALAVLIGGLLVSASPAGLPVSLFQLDGKDGGLLTGVVTGEATVLAPQDHQASFGASGLIYLTGRGITGADGSVGGSLSKIGLVCISELYVAASPVYAGGQARFTMVEADRFGVTIWVGQADGLGLHGAAFHFIAGCVGRTGRMN